jgi:UDP-N-acetylglucosamine 1-carboxyvinyltransferase
MKKLFITGGKPLKGEVQIAGAKNAASKMIIASMLTDEEVIIQNVPLHQETDIARELVETFGGETALSDHTLSVRVPGITQTSAIEMSRRNRLSILTVAPLLHRAGEAYVPKPEGDKIGPRPVNFHLDALEKMGATIEEIDDAYIVRIKKRLQGTKIELPYPSVGATETVLFASVLAEGRTVIKNAAIEPEIISLIMMLQKMGAIVQRGAGREFEIIGVEKLHGCTHRVIADRLEAASFACIALATRGQIYCRDAGHSSMITFLNAIRRIGGEYIVDPEGILFKGAPTYNGIEIETDAHPGFSTDWQQPFVVALTQANGTSVVHETVYQERFGYTKVLNEMGADITLSTKCLGELECRFVDQNFKHSAVIKGPTLLRAAKMTVPDIRAGLAYVAAALSAQGTSEIDGVEHLERGYEDLYGKLKSIGADIEVIEE